MVTAMMVVSILGVGFYIRFQVALLQEHRNERIYFLGSFRTGPSRMRPPSECPKSLGSMSRLTLATYRRRAAMAKKLILASMAYIILMAPITRAQKADVPKQPTKTSMAEQNVKELLLLMDADKNGRISKQEWMKFMEAQFDALDKDKTGELDQRELLKSTVTVKHPASANLGK
jgi:hypothetical protein